MNNHETKKKDGKKGKKDKKNQDKDKGQGDTYKYVNATPDLQIKHWMRFKPEEWKKLSRDQQKRVMKFNDERRNKKNQQEGSNNHNSDNQRQGPQSTYRTNHHESSNSQNQTQEGESHGNQNSNTQSTVSTSNVSLRQTLSNAATRNAQAASSSAPSSTPRQSVVVDGRTYYLSNTNIEYHVGNHEVDNKLGSLMDGGANGGLSGEDVRVIEETMNRADVTGINDHSIKDVPICTVAGVINSTQGPIIGIFHQYAHHGEGKTIHSTNQLRSFGVQIDDIPQKLGGKQRIKTMCGKTIPLAIRKGLAYMDMHPPSDYELENYPHVTFTSDMTWDPTILDEEEPFEIEDDQSEPPYGEDDINDFGEHLVRTSDVHEFSSVMDEDDISTESESNIKDRYNPEINKTDWEQVCMEGLQSTYDDFELYVDACLIEVHNRQIDKKEYNVDLLQPNFGFVPKDRVWHTLKNTTQYARADTRLPLRRHFKTRFPAANIPRLNEDVATDTFFSDVPAHDDGLPGHGGTTMAQLYTGTTSLLTEIFPMRNESEMVGTLQDFIRKRGAPNNLESDNAKAQLAKAVKDVLRHYHIGDFQCEPLQQNQNHAERRIQEIKKLSHQIMDRTGTPAKFWLLNVLFVCYLVNHLATQSIDWKTPIEVATGQKADTSALLTYRWWEPVYYLDKDNSSFPTKSKEKLGRWVGVAENKGDALTYWVLTSETEQVIARSVLCLATKHPNLKADKEAEVKDHNPFGHKPIFYSAAELAGHEDTESLKLPRFDPENLIGVTFLRDEEDGTKLRAKVTRKIMDRDAENHQNIKFLIEIGSGELEEIITYTELCDIIEKQQLQVEENDENY